MYSVGMVFSACDNNNRMLSAWRREVMFAPLALRK